MKEIVWTLNNNASGKETSSKMPKPANSENLFIFLFIVDPSLTVNYATVAKLTVY